MEIFEDEEKKVGGTVFVAFGTYSFLEMRIQTLIFSYPSHAQLFMHSLGLNRGLKSHLYKSRTSVFLLQKTFGLLSLREV